MPWILLIDDDRAGMEVLREFLRGAGHEANTETKLA